jgi:hypothetical protein
MKFLASLSISAMLMSSFSSCSKCYECNFGSATAPDTKEMCRKDFPGNKDMFEPTIQGYEDAGYICTAK